MTRPCETRREEVPSINDQWGYSIAINMWTEIKGMSRYLEFSTPMTGSKNSGHPHPVLENLSAESIVPHSSPQRRSSRSQQFHKKMTPLSTSNPPIQLTPLWEHVVRIVLASIKGISFVTRQGLSLASTLSKTEFDNARSTNDCRVWRVLIYVYISESIKYISSI